jgi:hypothetical protein
MLTWNPNMNHMVSVHVQVETAPSGTIEVKLSTVAVRMFKAVLHEWGPEFTYFTILCAATLCLLAYDITSLVGVAMETGSFSDAFAVEGQLGYNLITTMIQVAAAIYFAVLMALNNGFDTERRYKIYDNLYTAANFFQLAKVRLTTRELHCAWFCPEARSAHTRLLSQAVLRRASVCDAEHDATHATSFSDGGSGSVNTSTRCIQIEDPDSTVAGLDASATPRWALEDDLSGFDKLLADFHDFDAISTAFVVYFLLQGFNFALLLLRVMLTVRFHKKLNFTADTLSECGLELSHFLVLFFYTQIVMGMLSHLLFGLRVEDYSTLSQAVFSTMVLSFCGAYDHHGEILHGEFHVLGTLEQTASGVFLAVLVGLMFMVMNNFVLGIIGDAYGAIKEENQAYPSLFMQIWDLNMLEVRMN